MLFILLMRANGAITAFFLPERLASSSNFQGIVIRIKGFPAGNRLAQKYEGEKKSTVRNRC